MSDVTQTQTTEPPLANSTEAREADGTLKDQSAPPQPSVTTEASTTEPTAAEPPAVPETYQFTAPEGFEVNPEVVAEITPLFKELGLGQEAAQKLFDFHQKHASKSQTELVEHYETTRKGWRDSVIADKSLGDGTAGLQPAVKKAIAAAVDRIPADIREEFKNVMDLTGAGDHPVFLKAMNAIGRYFIEGTSVTGKGPSPLGQTGPNSRPSSPAQALYPNLPSSAS